MADPGTAQEALEKLQVRRRQLEAAYLRTQEYLKSLEWQNLRDRVLVKIEKEMATYHGKDATEAVFICGKIKQIMLEVQEPTDIIAEYEGIEKTLAYYAARAG